MTILLMMISSKKDEASLNKGVQIIANENIILGRSSSCSLTIGDSKCSKQHVSARLAGNKIIIKDLDSRNGTYVNGMKIKEAYLFLKDTLRIGKTIFTLDEASMTEGEKTLLLRPESFAGSGSFDLREYREFPYPQTQKERDNISQLKQISTKKLKLDVFGLAKQQFRKKMNKKEIL